MKPERLNELLIKNGYKVTKQREIIFAYLNKHKGEHLSPEDVHALVNQDDYDIGIATIYRTLLLFEELGVVYKLDFDDKSYRYEIADENRLHQHHHLICSNCGKVEEVRDPLLETVEEKIATDYKFQINDHELKFYGICYECQNLEETKERNSGKKTK